MTSGTISAGFHLRKTIVRIKTVLLRAFWLDIATGWRLNFLTRDRHFNRVAAHSVFQSRPENVVCMLQSAISERKAEAPPAIQICAPEKAKPQIAKQPEQKNDGPLAGKNILVVDDHPLSRQVAAKLLESAGATVILAGNGRQALDMLQQSRVNCVLMDLQMPVMGGMEATCLIRADRHFAGLPIIAMTANVRPEDRIQCKAAGMDGFIAKPLDPLTFIDKVTTWALHGRHSVADRRVMHVNWKNEDIDLTRLAETFSQQPEKIGKFAQSFLTSSMKSLNEIEQALGSHNVHALKALGHRAKSPAKVVGATRFAELCTQLEKIHGPMALMHATRIVAQMQASFGQIEKQIKQYLPIFDTDQVMR